MQGSWLAELLPWRDGFHQSQSRGAKNRSIISLPLLKSEGNFLLVVISSFYGKKRKISTYFFFDLVWKWGAIKYEILFWNFVWSETANQVFFVQQYFLPVNVLAVTQVTFFFLISRIQVLLCCINCNVSEFPESLNVLNIKVIVL